MAESVHHVATFYKGSVAGASTWPVYVCACVFTMWPWVLAHSCSRRTARAAASRPEAMRMRAFREKMAARMYGHPMEGALDLRNGLVSEKTPQIF